MDNGSDDDQSLAGAGQSAHHQADEPVPVPASLHLLGATRYLTAALALGVGLGLPAIIITTSINAAHWFTAPALTLIGCIVWLCLSTWMAWRLLRRGIRADERGIVVDNTFSGYEIPWEALWTIVLEPVEREGGGISHYRLKLLTLFSDWITCEAPGGSNEPGGKMDRAMRTLLAMHEANIPAEPEGRVVGADECRVTTHGAAHLWERLPLGMQIALTGLGSASLAVFLIWLFFFSPD